MTPKPQQWLSPTTFTVQHAGTSYTTINVVHQPIITVVYPPPPVVLNPVAVVDTLLMKRAILEECQTRLEECQTRLEECQTRLEESKDRKPLPTLRVARDGSHPYRGGLVVVEKPPKRLNWFQRLLMWFGDGPYGRLPD